MMLTALGMVMGADGWITKNEEDEKVKSYWKHKESRGHI